MPNLYVLSQKCIKINDIYIIGCTLWTNFKEKYLPNYIVRIRNFNKKKYNIEHFKDLKFIKRMLNMIENKKCIIITHHPPIITNDHSIKNGKKKNFPSLYYNDLQYLIKKNKNILMWISGHTHENFDINIDTTRLLSNQYGKIYDNITNYSKNFTISL